MGSQRVARWWRWWREVGLQRLGELDGFENYWRVGKGEHARLLRSVGHIDENLECV